MIYYTILCTLRDVVAPTAHRAAGVDEPAFQSVEPDPSAIFRCRKWRANGSRM